MSWLKNFFSTRFLLFICLISLFNVVNCFRKYSKEDVIRLREEVREMFQHAYNGYLKYASNYDELRPLSCDGIDTWGSYSLTLIDALDTLAVMGNYTEYNRVVKILAEKSNFDADINVSVFETNIRIVGGLLSAHLMSLKAGAVLEPGWPCNGTLLRLAEDVARRLLPAFDTKTGMPYGTVNLRHGVPAGETPVTCTAGVGTFIVEFGALSRLTGDPIFEEVALNALYALWKYKSPIGLFGNHIDVQTGRWTAQDSGIGAGVDSYYEYLVKGALMLNRPELLEMFHEGRKAIDKYLKRDDWYVWVSMSKGQVTLPVFQSLEAYWPGVLSLIGETMPAMRTLHNYHSVWKQYGFLPEFYNIPTAEAGVNRENYPLRPELIESVMYLYRSTSDPYLLEVGEDILKSIQYSAKTPCGYATIKNVRDHRREDRMESFFLAETTKYLYLLFDPDNFLHNNGGEGTIYETSNGMCILNAGGYIFNTEAHPIDPSALRCCHGMPKLNLFDNFDREKFLGDAFVHKDISQYQKKCPETVKTSQIDNITIEIVQNVDLNESRKKILEEIVNNLKNESIKKSPPETNDNDELLKRKKVVTKIDNREELIKELEYSKFFFKEISAYLSQLLEKFQEMIDRIEMKHSSLFHRLDKFNISNERIELLEMEKNEIDMKILLRKHEFMKAYTTSAKNHLTLDIIKGLQKLIDINLNKSAEIEPRRIIHITEKILKSLRLRNEIEPDLYKNNQDIIQILIEAQTKYFLYIHEHQYHAEVFAILHFYDLHDFDDIEENEVVFDKLINAKRKKNIYEIVEVTIETIKPDLLIVFESYFKAHSYINFDTEKLTLLKKVMGEYDKILNEKGIIENSEKIQEVLDKIKQNDDIIVAVDNKENQTNYDETEKEIGQGTVEPVHFDEVVPSEINQKNEKETEISSIIKPGNPEAPQLKTFVDDTNTSLISHFIQSILKSTLPAKVKFDPQQLLERIRANGIYLNQTQNFELFSCKAQPFLQRISVHGEFF